MDCSKRLCARSEKRAHAWSYLPGWRGPFARIESLSMGHGYGPEFGGDKAWFRLIPAGVGLSGGIAAAIRPHSFPALKICPQGLGPALLPALCLRGGF